MKRLKQYVFLVVLGIALCEMSIHAMQMAGSKREADQNQNADQTETPAAKKARPQTDNERSAKNADAIADEVKSMSELNALVQKHKGLTVGAFMGHPHFNPEETIDENGATLLHLAAQFGTPLLMMTLLNVCGADGNAHDKNSLTPLHYASTHGRINSVRLLLQAGADVNSVTSKKESSLYMAALQGHYHIVQLLIHAGADVNANVEETTLLHAAAANGHVAVARLLLDAGADINMRLGQDVTALHMASVLGHSAVVELLLYYGADTTIRDKQGKTAFETAANSHIMALIHNAKNSSPETKQLTLLHDCMPEALQICTAAAEGNLELLRMTLKKPINSVRKIASKHLIPLHLAIESCQLGSVRMLLTPLNSIEPALTIADRHGNTPLHLAVLQNHPEITHIILDKIVATNKKELLNRKNARKETPLMIAASISLPTTEPIIERLLELGADQTGFKESLPDFMKAILEK